MSSQKYICWLCYKCFENSVTLVSISQPVLTPTQVIKSIEKLFKSIDRHSHSARLLDYSDFNFKLLKGQDDVKCSSENLTRTGICSDCEELVSAICDLHHEIKCLELRLEWKIETLEGIMKLSGRIPSRLKHLKSHCDEIDRGLKREKNVSYAKIHSVRRKLMKACATRRSTNSPRIILRKYMKHDGDSVSTPAAFHKPITGHSIKPKESSQSSASTSPVPANLQNDDDDCMEEESTEMVMEDPLETFSAVESPNESSNSHKLIADTELVTDEPLLCGVAGCKEKFSLPQELENHSKMHGQFTCSMCSMVMTFAPDLAQHEADEHAETSASNNFQCPRCTFTLNCSLKQGKTSFMKHFLSTHLNLNWATLICAICGVRYFPADHNQRKRYQTRHFRKTHDVSDMNSVDVHKCDQCPAYFKNVSALRLHKKIVHLVTKTKLKCGECGKEFRKRGHRRKHLLKVHKTPFPFSCSVPGCTQTFPDQDDLSSHIEAVHKHETLNGEVKTYKCRQCGHLSKGRLEHLKHIGGHNKKKEKYSFVCEQCGKAFKRKENLHVHSLSHSGRDSWQFCCDICGRKFTTKQRLTEHGRTHTMEKPFQCSICGEKYGHRHNLKNHINKKHADVVQDVPKCSDKSNMTSKRRRKRKMSE